MDPEAQTFCLIMGAAFAGIIVFAYIAKMVEVRRASTWQVTTGTVTKSKVRARKRRDIDDKSSFESEPLVTYEYEVGGRHYRGTRISLAERISGAAVGETLARFPVGKRVQVYYNPANPEEAVLERELPPAVGKGVGILVLLFVGAGIAIPLALNSISVAIAPLLPNPERAPMVTLLGAMGAFALLIAFAIQRQVWATRGWSQTSGRILRSETEAYREWVGSGKRSRARTFFRPSVVYAFEVNGQQYISDHVSFGGQVGASSPGLVRGLLAKYPEDSTVTVYYDPQNPTESVLERRASGMILLVGIAFAMFALAAMIASNH